MVARPNSGRYIIHAIVNSENLGLPEQICRNNRPMFDLKAVVINLKAQMPKEKGPEWAHVGTTIVSFRQVKT